jgi:hypothetical protein
VQISGVSFHRITLSARRQPEIVLFYEISGHPSVVRVSGMTTQGTAVRDASFDRGEFSSDAWNP